ncbi:tetratricopeptide repeat protein [Streptomyces fragilis]|uniref:Tetratricopeptide repeat protein n=1 Tax=Streptomyces fragilis TaxID=67301 RepID=A0ABV2YHE4_9ACTN|nr:tetratricopeptide repeat protein [Streptomyces fragilis]
MTRQAITRAVAVARRRRRSVLWLDDLQDYLGAEGLTPSALDSLLDTRRGRVVVVATMRSEEHRRFEAREESRLTGPDRDAWRTQRDVLRRAVVIRLARRWSDGECHRAGNFRADPRIRLALRNHHRFGIAEMIAAGPELLTSWQNAWAPGANPRGAAVVAAAVDCRRAGLKRPVLREWLRHLHVRYLEERGGPDLQPESFDDAMRWACQAAFATSGLLTGNYTQGYMAFDYLLEVPDLPAVPDHLWDGLLQRSDPPDAYDLGIVAHQEGRLARAVTALERASQAGVPGADLALAIALGDSGKPRRAVRGLRAVVEERTTRLGLTHPDTLVARHQLAFFVSECGDWPTATELSARLVEDMGRTLGAGHPDTLSARHQLAYCMGESGDPDAAAARLRVLRNDRRRILGPAHPQTIGTTRTLIWYAAVNGPLEEAEADMRQLLRTAVEALGPDESHTLAIRSSLASFALRAGRTDEAVSAFHRLAQARTALLGAAHPHTVRTLLDAARALAAAGDRGRASAALDEAVRHASRSLEPGHRLLREAESLLAAVHHGPTPGGDGGHA